MRNPKEGSPQLNTVRTMKDFPRLCPRVLNRAVALSSIQPSQHHEKWEGAVFFKPFSNLSSEEISLQIPSELPLVSFCSELVICCSIFYVTWSTTLKLSDIAQRQLYFTIRLCGSGTVMGHCSIYGALSCKTVLAGDDLKTCRLTWRVFTHVPDICAGKSQSLGSAGSVDLHTYTYSLLVTWASLQHGGEIPRRDIQIRCYKRI